MKDKEPKLSVQVNVYQHDTWASIQGGKEEDRARFDCRKCRLRRNCEEFGIEGSFVYGTFFKVLSGVDNLGVEEMAMNAARMVVACAECIEALGVKPGIECTDLTGPEPRNFRLEVEGRSGRGQG
jgi:hypothetical protein